MFRLAQKAIGIDICLTTTPLYTRIQSTRSHINLKSYKSDMSSYKGAQQKC